MLGVDGLRPWLRNPLSILCTIPRVSAMSVPKTHQIPLSPFNSGVSSFASNCTGHGGFSAHALEKGSHADNGILMETVSSAFEDAQEDVSDEDEGEDLPLGHTRKGHQKKPPGFGEGKVYDTSVEDKLFDELQQSRRAQLANINRLKNSSSKNQFKSNRLGVQNAADLFPGAAHVFISNLPKKRNIHRDLLAIFRDFPGLIKIRPAVSGNKKTRDPICKGYAFVDLKSSEDAMRFLQSFSKQSFTFGKIQRHIRCAPISDPVSKLDTELVLPRSEDLPKKVEPALLATKKNTGDGKKLNTESTSHLQSSNKTQMKKKTVDMKVARVPKTNVLGSAARLMVREKAVLKGVFLKYSVASSSG